MRTEEYLQGILGALGVGENKGVPNPVWRHEEYLKQIYERANDIASRIKALEENPANPKDPLQLRKLVRNHTIEKYLQPGDLIRIPKASGVSVTVTGNVSSATVTAETFIEAVGHSETAAYEFIFDGAIWTLNGDAVELANYGITAIGTPTEHDAIVVHVQADHIVFETLGIGCDVPVNPNLDNSISFLTRDVQIYGSVARCAPQALVSVQEAIPAGAKAYVIGDHCAYNGSTTEDGNFGFIAPGDIPAGAKIKHSTMGKSQTTYAKSNVIGGMFAIYTADYNVLYDNIETIEDDTGILLGTVTAVDPQYLVNNTAHVNFTQRNIYGSNRAAHAAHSKWLNSLTTGASTGEIASWWIPSDEFDMPIRSTLPGFLNGIDPEFRDCLVKVWKRTAKSLADGLGFEDTQELVWVPSMTETGFGNNNSIVETSPIDIGGVPNWIGAYPLYNDTTNASCVKHQEDTAKNWFLRSPHPSSANDVRHVSNDGSLYSNGANRVYGAVAGFSIA